MALLSSGHYERDNFLDGVDLIVRADTPDYPGPPSEAECDFESSLAYSLGYGNSSLEASLQSPVSATEKAEDHKNLTSKYVSVDIFPFEKFSIIRCCRRDRREYYKNIYALSLVFFLVIGAHEGLVGVQTTINLKYGLIFLAIENAFLVCTVVIAPAVIWLLGIRNTMLLGCTLQVGFVASNYLRELSTLIPGAVVGGFSIGILWVSASLYKSITATTVANIVGAKPTVVIGKFGGVFYFFVSISLMIGNLISSILFFSNDEDNCDVEESNSTISFTIANNNSVSVCSCDSGSGIGEITRLVLVSIYILGDILAIVLLLLTVKNIPRVVTDPNMLRTKMIHYLKNSVVSIARVQFSTKALFLIPVFLLEGLQTGYYLGTFSREFIVQCIGVRYVGFAIAVWALGSAIGSLTAGRTVKYVKRFTLFIIATGLSIFLSLFLIFFKRVESFSLVFLVSLGFGLSDGILKTAISCLVGGRFPKLKTTVFSILRMWIGVALILHFTLAIALPHVVLLWIIVAASIISLPLYGLVDRSGRFLCI